MTSKRLLCSLVTLGVALMTSPGQANAASNDTAIIVGFSQGEMKNDVPSGWELDKKAGKPVIRMERDNGGYVVNMVSDSQSSFGIKKAVKVNIKEYPFLNWRWKAAKLPTGGDVRNSDTDDQAAQIYIAFPATGFPARLNTPVLSYIWDNEAPKEWMGRSPQIGGGKLKYIVVRNKTDKLGEWYTEKRNILHDYQKAFKDLRGGEPTGPTNGISLYINSQHTQTSAECSIGSVSFSRQ